MTQYIMTSDKNGKARYYKVVDGKKKVIGKAEYEANATAVVEEITEAAAEVVEITENAQTAEVVADDTAENDVVEIEVAAVEVPQIAEIVEAEKIPQIAETAEVAKPSESKVADDSKEIAEIALAIVKSVIAATGSKHADKIRLQIKKNCVLINYRNCMVCSLVFDENHSAKALKFMGDTLETRKQASVYEYGDLNSHKEEIVKQANFIDWWYANPTKKVA